MYFHGEHNYDESLEQANGFPEVNRPMHSPKDIQLRRLISRLKLKHLDLLRTLGDVTTLKKAAKELSISQPSASARLREIEDAVDIKLFDRHPHGIRPNKFGETLIVWSEVILNNLERATNDLQALASNKSGRIKIGITPVVGQTRFAKSLIEFHNRYPSLLVSIQIGHDTDLLPCLKKGELDIVICRLVPSALTNTFRHEVLYTDCPDIVVRANHPLLDKKPFIFSELDKYEWIIPPIGSASFEQVAKTIIAAGAALPRVAFETTTTVITSHLLQESNLIALLPSNIATSYISGGVLVRLPISLLSSPQSVVALTRTSIEKSFPEYIDLLQMVRKFAATGTSRNHHSPS